MIEKEFVLSPDLVILSRSDLLGNITGYNEGFRDASGYTDAELMGAQHRLLRHPDMPKKVFQDYWDTIQAGYTWSGVVKNLRKDGLFYWVFAHVTPITEQGKIVGYVSVRYPATMAQITEAEALYADIRAGRRSFPVSCTEPEEVKQTIMFAGLLAFAPFVLLTQAVIDGSAWLAGFGGVAALISGLVVYRLQQSDQPSQVQKNVLDRLANGFFRESIEGCDAWSLVLNNVRARLAEFSALRYDAKKTLEQKAELLAESSRYKSEFLANMGHELRTPLNSINVLAGLLQQNTAGNLTKQQVEQLQVIHYAGRDLLELINDLLDFSKIEAGKMSVVLEQVDLVRLARDM